MMLLSTTTAYQGDGAGADALDRCLSELAAGDLSALDALYTCVSTAIYSFALSILKNSHDAEDVLQDSFLNIYSGASSYRSSGKPMAWILTIAKNLCYQKLRDRKKLASLPEEDWQGWLTSNEALSEEDKLIIRQCMEQLSDQERQIVTLHAVAGFLHREIAELFSLPLPTVLSKYHRAIKKLRQSL